MTFGTTLVLIPKAWPLYCTESLYLLAYHVKDNMHRDKRNTLYLSYTEHRCVRFDVLMAVYMQTAAFWDITLHSGRQVQHIWKNILLPTLASLEMKMEATDFSTMLITTRQTELIKIKN